MQNKKIILVNFPLQGFKPTEQADIEQYGYNPSFSLIALGTWLEFNGYEVELMDLYSDPISWKDFVQNIVKANVLFLGCTVHTVNVDLTLKALKAIRKHCPNINIVVGGPHASLCPEDFLMDDTVDYVSVNEGESTLLELAEALRSNQEMIQIEQIPGLVYRGNAFVTYTPKRPFIQDMDLLPIIKREFFSIDRYQYVVNMITGRGCPGSCIYCAANVLSGKAYRSRCVENVYLEIVLIKILLKERLTKIYFVDDTFTADKERVLKFIRLLGENHMDLIWSCQSRIDSIDYEIIDQLASHGCVEVLYGIESGNQAVVNQIGKHIMLDKVWDIMQYTHNRRIHIVCSFILGHYCDTKETMNDTYEMVKRIYQEFGADIAIYLNTPYPGTSQYIHCKKLGLRIVEKDYSKYTNVYPVVETDQFTIADQLEVFYKCISFFSRCRNLETKRKELLKSID